MRAVSGVAWVGEGRARFAVDTTRAARVLLHLFSGPDGAGQRVIELAREDRSTFAVTIDDVRPGTLYGYRVYGPAATEPGDRFDPGALLVDPRALAIHGALDWATTDASQRAAPGAPVDPRGRPLGVVVGPLAPLDASRPRTPIADTVIYEVHVKGATQLHPDVPASQRGTYQGLAHPAMIEHLRSFGVTAVELLPVQEMIDERALVARGLRNYWGYNPIGLFAPAGRYAAGGARGEQVAEFRAMVAALHRAGLEVILDVVFNHTAEGSARGPTLSLRGLDNAGYYLLDPGDPRRYLDCSGCGNSLDFGRPLARALVRDCLRHWVVAMGVDGFRLDLAPTLLRSGGRVDPDAAFLRELTDDPALAGVKWIAEPWDVGAGGYRLGAFPRPWSEWNDRYRDGVRRFWRGDRGRAGDLATRVSGSQDTFAGRGPLASVNYVTAHDGFTLRDLVSYARKHNDENGEGGRDGHAANFSDHHGVEGPTDDPAILERRARQQRNLLLTLAASLGVPMLCGGDELDRTQGGNNNAYCHDSPRTWIDWEVTPARAELLAFTRRVLALRRARPALRASLFRTGAHDVGAGLPDVSWLTADGARLEGDAWALTSCLGMLLGPVASSPALLVLFNAGDAVRFALPGARWRVLVDTRAPDGVVDPRPRADAYTLAPRSAAILERLTRDVGDDLG